MAITIQPTVVGNILSVGGVPNYCYLYEPFEISITESDTAALKLFVDVKISNLSSIDIVESTKIKYVEYDFSSVKTLSIDLMEIAQQMNDANIYKIGSLSDITSSSNETVLSKVMYTFEIYTDATLTPSVIKKIPIIGVREFTDYSPIPLSSLSTPVLTEFEANSIDLQKLINRWTNFKGIESTIELIDGVATSVTSLNSLIAPAIPPSGEIRKARGGMIFWKSRKGGWMFWGMDLSKKTYTNSSEGSLMGGMFRANSAGVPYIPVSYTEVKSTYSLELKSLSLSQLELKSVSGIAGTPVVYYQDGDFTKPLELMKLSSSSAPWTNLSNGGDFSVSLQSISITSQKTY